MFHFIQSLKAYEFVLPFLFYNNIKSENILAFNLILLIQSLRGYRAELTFHLIAHTDKINKKFQNVLNNTAQYNQAKHSTAQHSRAQYKTAQHSTAQNRTDGTEQNRTEQHSTAQHSTAQRSTQHITSQHHTPHHTRNHYSSQLHNSAFLT